MSFDALLTKVSPELLFHYEIGCKKASSKKALDRSYLLPDSVSLGGLDAPSHEFFMGWGHEGLFFEINITVPSLAVSYPNIEAGNSIELFIDTRNVKTARSSHRFCHHFFFLPEPVDGIQKGEITRFRTEDRHPICRPEDLHLAIDKMKKGYKAVIHLPNDCLHGYNPEDSSTIGFCYRVNRPGIIGSAWGFTDAQADLFTIPIFGKQLN